MQKITKLIALFALVLLIGGGCASGDEYSKKSSSDNDTASKSEVTDSKSKTKKSDKTTKATTQVVVTDFLLKATSLGNRTVKFEWELPDELAEKAEKYMVVRGTEKNPENPASWWWWRGNTYRDLEWSELPLGSAHFRVCVLAEDKCLAYSNDVVVEVE
jgi:hypothetical protein